MEKININDKEREAERLADMLTGAGSVLAPFILSSSSSGLVPPSNNKWVDEWVEESDEMEIERLIQDYYSKMEIEPEIISTADKDYYLPALKVLHLYKDRIVSPSWRKVWTDNRLDAACGISRRFQTFRALPAHPAPDESCECGIYASVNLTEIMNYFRSSPNSILTIIEPEPDAKVVLCLKGWRASSAFISEIIGETMSVDDASNLLSIAWKRNLDVRKVITS